MISKWSQKTVGPLVSARELACSYTGRPGSFTWCDWPPRVSPLAWLWHTWGAAGPLPLESGSHIHMDAASVVHKRLVPLSTGPGLGEEGPGPSLCPGSGQPTRPWVILCLPWLLLPSRIPSILAMQWLSRRGRGGILQARSRSAQENVASLPGLSMHRASHRCELDSANADFLRDSAKALYIQRKKTRPSLHSAPRCCCCCCCCAKTVITEFGSTS